ncbi:hypothetical protein D3C87_865960 [compost metagenome]
MEVQKSDLTTLFCTITLTKSTQIIPLKAPKYKPGLFWHKIGTLKKLIDNQWMNTVDFKLNKA